MKKLIFIFFLFVAHLGTAQNEELFERANQAYADANYDEAVQMYTDILENGETSAALHYNLGNAHYKLNNVAPSIYHYEKALLLAPGDKDVTNNLKFARKMAIDAIEEPSEEGFYGIFSSVTSVFSPTTWAWIGIISMLMFVVFFLGYYFSGKVLFKRILFIAGLVFLFLAVSSTVVGLLKQNLLENRSYAIIFAEEVEVKSEPNVRSSEVFLLHEGAKVKVTEDFQGWTEIELPNGSQGWIRSKELKLL
ncbi:tetratricopeptide repeat protein [Salinimicrobium gaetbulicola]|uniref:Tetratricopeptide repeat protein n=1 Tax=Salinimicrobium gaetbulicola TaxID=999702 RepID=A0ABW3IHZ5_9FLAO